MFDISNNVLQNKLFYNPMLHKNVSYTY